MLSVFLGSFHFWYNRQKLAGAGNHVFEPSGEPVRTSDDRSYHLNFDNRPPSMVDPVKRYVEIDRVKVIRG